MTIQLNSPAWRIAGTARARRSARSVSPVLTSIPPEFLSDESKVAEEVLLEPAGPLRGQVQGTAGLDLSYNVEPGQTAILAVRHSSGALTFHRPIESTARGMRGP